VGGAAFALLELVIDPVRVTVNNAQIAHGRAPVRKTFIQTASFSLLNATLGTLTFDLEPKDNVGTSLYSTGFSLCSVSAWRRRQAATNPGRVEIRIEDERLYRGAQHTVVDYRGAHAEAAAIRASAIWHLNSRKFRPLTPG
jgi:hypothetical protein